MNIPKGFQFAATQAAFKYEGKLDLGAIVSDKPAIAAGVFTTNKFKLRQSCNVRKCWLMAGKCPAF